MSQRINPYKMFVGSFLPNWLLERSELTSSSKIVYARLAQHAGADGHAIPNRETIAAETGLSLSMVKLCIKELKDNGLIEVHQRGLNQTNEYFFLAHNWMKYNRPDGQPDNRLDGQPASRPGGQPASHIRESVKRIKEENKSASAPEWLNADAWQSFKDHRKQIRKPLTARAETLAIDKLRQLRAAGHEPKAVIEQSILNGWAGLFEFKQVAGNANGYQRYRPAPIPVQHTSIPIEPITDEERARNKDKVGAILAGLVGKMAS